MYRRNNPDQGHFALDFWDDVFAEKNNMNTLSSEFPSDRYNITKHVEERDAAFKHINLCSMQEEMIELLAKIQDCGAQHLSQLSLGESEQSMRVRALVFNVQTILSQALDLEQKNRIVSKVCYLNDNNDENKLQLPKYSKVLYEQSKGDPLHFLEKYWGDYLSYFRAPKNILYQYHLRKLDGRLCSAVRNRLNYLRRTDKSVPRFQDIVPPKKQETDAILSSIPEQHLQKIEHVATRLSSRRQRQK